MAEKGKIIQQGAGGFLNPPTHPEHTYSVQTDLRRRVENRGSMSLGYAVACDYLDPATKAAAQALLDEWEFNKPALETAAVQDWILQVLGYFKGCYNFQPEVEEGWHCAKLTIDSDLDPMERIDFHAGVHLIRRYYPNYTPARLQFLRAYWGEKPGRKKAKA